MPAVTSFVISPPQPKRSPAPGGDEAENPFRGGAGPGVTNEAGINRVVWDFRTDGVAQWMGAARPPISRRANRTERGSGTYTARITLNGKTYSQSFAVKADPQSPYTQADFVAAHAFAEKYLRVSGQINTLLNHLDAQKASLTAAASANASNGCAAGADQRSLEPTRCDLRNVHSGLSQRRRLDPTSGCVTRRYAGRLWRLAADRTDARVRHSLR